MQVSSNKALTDEESIKLAQDIIFKSYKENRKDIDYNHQLFTTIVSSYNSSPAYVSLVEEIFRTIDNGDELYKSVNLSGKENSGSPLVPAEPDIPLDGFKDFIQIFKQTVEEMEELSKELDKKETKYKKD